ncbi:unnamed protein product [Camellia sinensis]
MIRKQGNTARESNTSNSSFSPLTELNPTRPSNTELNPLCLHTRPAMTRHTNMALRPEPPPALSWAPPLPENVHIAAFAPWKAHAPPHSYPGDPEVGPRQWNLITSFPSATHRLWLSQPPPEEAALDFTVSLYSSNRVTVLGLFWTLKTISIRPEKDLGDQLVWKIISTTLREGWPSGSLVRDGNNGSGAREWRVDVLGRIRFEPDSGFFELGGVAGGGGLGLFLGLCLVV